MIHCNLETGYNTVYKSLLDSVYQNSSKEGSGTLDCRCLSQRKFCQCLQVLGNLLLFTSCTGPATTGSANEGVFISIVDESIADELLALMRKHPKGKNATCVGHITAEHPKKVVMQSGIGGSRMVSPLIGEQLPRIC